MDTAAITLRRSRRGKPVEVWAFDEHRLGLKPLARRVWARLGRRPVAVIRGNTK